MTTPAKLRGNISDRKQVQVAPLTNIQCHLALKTPMEEGEGPKHESLCHVTSPSKKTTLEEEETEDVFFQDKNAGKILNQ